ncbi:MAG: ribonuclease P protein component [Salinivirgaceae bacterium]|nr:ribonuclease P protein component [Salinivirgaceae bacterium]
MQNREPLSERKTFRRHERLKSRSQIQSLFLQNRSIRSYPFKLVWTVVESTGPFLVKAGFTVSKRSFKLAMDRNLVKRRMRECFRLNKQMIYQPLNDKPFQLNFMIVYMGDELLDFKQSEAILKQLFARLTHKLKEL